MAGIGRNQSYWTSRVKTPVSGKHGALGYIVHCLRLGLKSSGLERKFGKIIFKKLALKLLLFVIIQERKQRHERVDLRSTSTFTNRKLKSECRAKG